MKEIIIGRNGTQPFAIRAEGVSGRHAMLTVGDDGSMTLRDLDSKNGTFVLDRETRRFNRVETVVIDRDTLVRLGPDDTIRSYQFVVRQLFKADQDDYSEEFQELRRRWRDLTVHRETLEERITVSAFIPVAVSVVLLVATFLLPESMSVNVRMNLMRCVMMVPALLSPVISLYGRRKLRQLTREMHEAMICPNPACRHTLTEDEIRRGQCIKCKKHI